MPIQRTTIGKGQIYPERLSDTLLDQRYVFETFMDEPAVQIKGSVTEMLPAGTSLTTILLDTGRYRFEYAFAGDNTDVFAPVFGSEGGYNWGGSSDVAGTGFEINFGGLLAAHPRNFKSGTDADWFARIYLIVDDASGADITFGFRKAGAVVATLTEITDVAGLRILGDSSSALAALSVVTNLNNGGTSDYSSTALTNQLTDATAIELEVQIKGRTPYFFVNGSQVGHTVTASYTFDDGDSLSPVVVLLQATDVAAQIKTLAYEAGPLDTKREGLLSTLAFVTS